jgi:hypothetical protein
MALDPNQTIDGGHLTAFVVDPERNLIRFACKFCGGTTEPMEVGKPLPEWFRSFPHEPGCSWITVVTLPNRRAA